eukprot:scaffold551008_cov34-Prasinocladus_malaysianus.AAC.1
MADMTSGDEAKRPEPKRRTAEASTELHMPTTAPVRIRRRPSASGLASGRPMVGGTNDWHAWEDERQCLASSD